MKVYKKFSPLTIEIETEEELRILITGLDTEYHKHKNGWHIIGATEAKRIAEVARIMRQKIEGTN